MEEEVHVRSDEELWADLLMLEGEDKADTLSCLAISYSGGENSQYAIALAEEAKNLYFEIGFDGTEIDFIFLWAVIAQSKAHLELWNDAIDAGLECHKLCEAHVYPGYENIRWDLIQWYLSANRFEEARAQFEMLYERYKYASELDYSDYEYIEIN